MSDRHGELDLKSAIRELASALEQGLDGHPSREDLVDFAVGDLSESERDRIQEHLALCRECARIADESAAAEPELGRLTTKDLDAEWKRFQVAAGINSSHKAHNFWALAAVLLFAVVGVGFATWVVRLSQQPQDQLSELRITSPVYLLPVVRERGKPIEPPRKVQVPGWADEVSLTLDLAGVERHPEYRLVLETAKGRRLWSRSGVQSGDEDLIGLGVPRGFLPPGAYQVRLFSPQKKEVAVYVLLIEP